MFKHTIGRRAARGAVLVCTAAVGGVLGATPASACVPLSSGFNSTSNASVTVATFCGGGGGGSTWPSQATRHVWSGVEDYSPIDDAFTDVHGQWTEPYYFPACGGNASTWVGLGGDPHLGDTSLIQAGVLYTWPNPKDGNIYHYVEFVEAVSPSDDHKHIVGLDANGNGVPVTVQPGDKIWAGVSDLPNNPGGGPAGTFSWNINDVTRGSYISGNFQYATGQNQTDTTAEWIQERPQNNGVAGPLEDWSNTLQWSGTGQEHYPTQQDAINKTNRVFGTAGDQRVTDYELTMQSDTSTATLADASGLDTAGNFRVDFVHCQ
jgi:hypothetical protein